MADRYGRHELLLFLCARSFLRAQPRDQVGATAIIDTPDLDDKIRGTCRVGGCYPLSRGAVFSRIRTAPGALPPPPAWPCSADDRGGDRDRDGSWTSPGL